MTLTTKPYKGARDFYPEDKRLQKYIFNVMRDVCERYGYVEYDAPLLEPTDLYLQKGNQEIIEKQTYTFVDRGDRSVTLRTEMTPSVSRMVAGRRQELAYPLRWYSIPQCWRYERMQRGRGREFYQLNVDIFGEAGVSAEHELLLLTRDLLRAYGADESLYTMRLNSRAMMQYFFVDYLKIPEEKVAELNRLIDRLHKIENDDFDRQLDELLAGAPSQANTRDAIRSLLRVTNMEDLPEHIKSHPSSQPLQMLINLLHESGLTNVVFDPTITRGFDYYTDIVFEVFDAHPDNNRSMFGGGRYDSLVADFGVDSVPTVGFGMGDMTLQNFLEIHNLLPDLRPETDIYAICIGDVYSSGVAIADQLREQGVRVALDATGRKLDKSIKAADKKAIPYVLFIGKNEVESGVFTLRELSSGREQKGTIQNVATFVR